MTSTFVQIFEFGHVTSHSGILNNTMPVISESAFNYLKLLALSEHESARALRLKGVKGVEAIQFQNYAGVIVTPDGTQIEILPKEAKIEHSGDTVIASHAALLNMIRSLGQFRHLQTDAANVLLQRMPLLEVFIRQFLASVNGLVKQGLKREYSEKEDNLLYLKGKLNISEQLKRNLIQKQRFAIAYDEYLPNTLPNQLIKAALRKVTALARAIETQRLAHELEFAFTDVDSVSFRRGSGHALTVSRGMEHYRAPLAWAQIILDGLSPLSMQGTSAAFSLLFPMEAIFESFVAHTLRNTLPTEIRLKGQAAEKYLVEYGKQTMFALKPDITLYHADKLLMVLDTKWKTVDIAENTKSSKFELSQSDFYQMFAYGHKYLKGCGNLVLIYPSHAKFYEPLATPFTFSNELALWVVPFDIHHQTPDTLRLMLPNELQRQLTSTRIPNSAVI